MAESEVSGETAAEAARVIARAAVAPTPGEVADLAARAVQCASGLDDNEVRELTRSAVDLSEQVTELLYRLNLMLSGTGGAR